MFTEIVLILESGPYCLHVDVLILSMWAGKLLVWLVNHGLSK